MKREAILSGALLPTKKHTKLPVSQEGLTWNPGPVIFSILLTLVITFLGILLGTVEVLGYLFLWTIMLRFKLSLIVHN